MNLKQDTERTPRTIKLLCVSDEKDPLVYSQNLKERYGDVHAVIGAGDLPMEYYGFIVTMINKPLYFVFGNHQLRHIKQFKNPKNHIFEHHDMYQSTGKKKIEQQDFFGSTYIGGRVRYLRDVDLIVAGMGGSRRYNNGENQFSELQMYLKLCRLVPRMAWNRIRRGRWIDILVTHAPPSSIHDQEDLCHRGFTAFLWFMRTFKPRFLLHGHVHLHDINEKRIDTYEQTQVINVYQHYLLEVENDG